MNENAYTKEQQEDIQERVAKAIVALKELELQPACMPQLQNTGDDIFGIKLIPFLQDLKYAPVPSPFAHELA